MSILASKSHVFVSHSHADNEFCLRLIHDLRAAYGDEAVWFDNAGGLAPGDEWWAKIRAELRARAIFIVVLSPEAVTSPWVNDEVSLAWSQRNSPGGKLIIPLIHQRCDIRDDLKSLRNTVSFVDPAAYAASLKKLCGQIDDFTRKQALAQQRAAEKAAAQADKVDIVAFLLQRRAITATVSAVLLVAAFLSLTHWPHGVSGPTVANIPRPTETSSATATATIAPTATPTLAQLSNQAVPGPCVYPAAWQSDASIIGGEAQLSSTNFGGAFICKADSVELATHARTEGDYGSVSLKFAPQGAALPLKHKYQIVVIGWPPHVSGALSFSADGATLTFQRGTADSAGSFPQFAMVDCDGTRSSGPANSQTFPSSIDVQEQFDGQTTRFWVSGQSVGSCPITSHSDNQSQLAISYAPYAADTTKISALFLKNFVFTSLS